LGAANNVAVFAALGGNPAEGREQLRVVVDRLAEVFGADHPDTLRTMGNLEIATDAASGGRASIGRMRVADRLADRVGQEHPSVVMLRDGRYVRRVLDPHPY
jgi:hypothetical protein